MSYEVLSSELYEDSDEKRSIRSKRKGPKKDKFKISPFYIHLGLVLLFLIFLFFLFTYDFSFDFGSDEGVESSGNFIIVGDMQFFNISYVGNLSLISTAFVLDTQSGKFTEGSKDFEISGFNGKIFHENKSIVIEGIADKIQFGSSSLNVNGGTFSLKSYKKTGFDVEYDNLSLYFDKGSFRMDKNLKFEFINGSVDFSKVNVSVNYDGAFTFSGKSDLVELNAPSQGVLIKYS